MLTVRGLIRTRTTMHKFPVFTMLRAKTAQFRPQNRPFFRFSTKISKSVFYFHQTFGIAFTKPRFLLKNSVGDPSVKIRPRSTMPKDSAFRAKPILLHTINFMSFPASMFKKGRFSRKNCRGFRKNRLAPKFGMPKREPRVYFTTFRSIQRRSRHQNTSRGHRAGRTHRAPPLQKPRRALGAFRTPK